MFCQSWLALTGPVLATLLALFGQSAYPGFSHLSQWPGCWLAGIGRSNVEAAFTDYYTEQSAAVEDKCKFYQATRKRTMLDSNGGFS